MSGFEKDEWRRYAADKASKRVNGSRAALEQIQQAQVRMDALTGDPHWDLLLSYVQSAIERATREAEQHVSSLVSPMVVNPDEIMGLKIAHAQLEGQIQAWAAVMDLPKDIKESGEQAKTLLERIDDDG